MAGLTDFCGEIAAGFIRCGKTPSSAGIEPGLYAYNKDQFIVTYDVTNPLIVTGFTRVDIANVMYKIEGFGDNFNAISKPNKKTVGARYTETIKAYIADNSTATKQLIHNGLIGRICFIVINNDKSTNGAVELYGAVNGLQFTDNTQRDAANEDLQGAWDIEAMNPPKLLEPFPPRAVLIGTTPTFATTLAALEAFLIPAEA